MTGGGRKLGFIVFVFIGLAGIAFTIWYLRYSNQSINLSDFKKHYGHPYYAEMQETGQRIYFEESVSDLVKYLGEETGCCLDSVEAAAYLEYMLEEKGYEVNIIVGQDQGEAGILIYDELQDDWVQWKWSTKSLSDFTALTYDTDTWNEWNQSKKYEDIYQIEEESVKEFDWWNLPEAEKLDEFAQSSDYLPSPGFRISNVNACVDENNWRVVDGESMATVQLSYIINRYGDYESEEPGIHLKIYDDDNRLLMHPAPEDSIYRGCDSLLLSEGNHSIKVQIARLGTLAYGECHLEVHTQSFYQQLEKCTYNEVEAFINADTTDMNEYIIDEYNCRNFTCDVAKNANNEGLKAAYVGIYYNEPQDEIEGHAIVCFETIDQGLVFIEPQNDERVELHYGSYYLNAKIVEIYAGRVSGEECLIKSWPEMEENIKMEFFSSLNEDTVIDAIISQLSLAAETQTSEDYVEDYIAALYYSGNIQVSSGWDADHKCWDVLLQVTIPSIYEYGDECWSSALWKIWDDGVIVPCNTNALSILLTSTSD